MIKQINTKFNTRSEYLRYYYHYLGNKLIFVGIIYLLVGLLDGLGLSMFIPLLQAAADQDQSVIKSGSFSFLLSLTEQLGIPLNIISILLILCFLFLIKGLASFAGAAYKVTVQQRFVRMLRLDALNSLSGISFKRFTTADVGRIQNTMTGEVARLSLSLSYYLAAIQGTVLVIVYTCLAMVANPQFAGIVALGGLLTNLLFKQIYSKTKKTSATLTKESHSYQGLLIQFITNFKYLKATGKLFGYGKKLEQQIRQIEQNNQKLGMLGGLATSLREPSMIIVVALAIIVQHQIFQSPLNTIMVSLLFFYRALSSLLGIQTAWNSFLGVSGSINNMRDFQKDLSQNQEKKGNISITGFKDKLELRNIQLNYGDINVLNSINLTIKKNMAIALVGESGSGKTSLLNIISGLLPPDKGQLLIDGIPSHEINISSFQQRIGYITQEPVIFNASIYDNITSWAENTVENKEIFEEVIHKAELYSFIQSLPEKQFTELGNNGINLSGGQKQRIAIARELFKQIDLLIMDEATSALDSETERSIQSDIDALKGKCTILIAAHRLSTIKNVDQVVLMRKGTIVNIAPYDQMVQNSSEFKRMIQLQELQ